MFHHKRKTIAQDFLNRIDHSKIIYRSEIRSYISKQIQANKIQNYNKKNVQKVMNQFNLLAKDWSKIQGIIKYLLRKKKLKRKYHENNSNENIRNTDGNFLRSDNPPYSISRYPVRAFLYEHVFINSDIRDVIRQNINLAMKQFSIRAEERQKVIKMLSAFIEQDSYILSPDIHDPLEDADYNIGENADENGY